MWNWLSSKVSSTLIEVPLRRPLNRWGLVSQNWYLYFLSFPRFSLHCCTSCPSRVVNSGLSTTVWSNSHVDFFFFVGREVYFQVGPETSRAHIEKWIEVSILIQSRLTLTDVILLENLICLCWAKRMSAILNPEGVFFFFFFLYCSEAALSLGQLCMCYATSPSPCLLLHVPGVPQHSRRPSL